MQGTVLVNVLRADVGISLCEVVSRIICREWRPRHSALLNMIYHTASPKRSQEKVTKSKNAVDFVVFL